MSLDNPSSEAVDLHTLAKSVEDAPEVVSWLNSILDEGMPGPRGEGTSTTPIDLTALDRRVSSILSSVEIVAEESSSQLERIIDDISRGAPRLAYDLHFMKESAISLQSSLRKLQHASTSAESPETKDALERLHYLDNVKRGMEAARDVLREAESWSSLESEVSLLLSEQNYEKAAETLSEAAKSMVVFQNTPEYESRRSLMVSLQNQLEASLSSALVAAINSQDLAVCKNYFSIFKNIQREAEFRNYYYGSRRGPLIATWQKARLREADAEATPDSVSLQTFATFLPSFFASFSTLLETERSSIPLIFPDPPGTLSALISSALSSLQPTFSQRLSSVANSHGSYTLTEIISGYTATIEFANSTENIMEKVTHSTSPHLQYTNSEDSTTSDTPSKVSRRRSRLSISRRISRASISLSHPPNLQYTLGDQEWQQELFEPFLDYQVDYGSLEQKLLTERLEQATAAENTAPGRPKDGSRWLRERSVDAFSLADQSLSRCMAFTHGYGFVGLVQALDFVFASILHSSNEHISTDNRLLSMDSSALSGGDDLSDMDYTTQDWSRIQMYLRLLGSAHGFSDRLGTFESKMRVALVQVSENIRTAQGDIFSPAKLLSNAPKGALQILAQSTLNSMELQNMLKLLEPDTQQQFLGLAHSPRIPHTVPSQPLNVLTGTRGAVSDFARSCQVSLQKTILSPLHKHLASYALLPVWASSKPAASKLPGGTGALTEIQVPVFSISPGETVQRVAEGLLNLPRLFEVYADDDALAFSIETLPFVDEDLLRSVTEQFHPEGHPHPPTGPTPGIHHSRRSSSIGLKAPPAGLAIPAYAAPAVLSPEAVSAAWLSSLALSLLTHLTSSVLPKIKTLTPTGAAQLSSDLGYLSNVVQALNVRSTDLEKWKDLSEFSDEDGKRQARDKEIASGDQTFLTVAKMRGWV